MSIKKSYIYVRNHSSYDEYEGCKLGKTNNIPERDIQYATGEIKRGSFELVIQMESEKTSILVEKLLQHNFNCLGYHIQKDGGTEFYKRYIIDKIVPYLKKTNLNFKVLSQEEIKNLIRNARLNEILKKINKINFDKIIKKKIKAIKKRREIRIVPYEHQQEVLDVVVDFYNKNRIGKIIWACGLGKALLSILISKELDCKNVVIGVPTKYLQRQMSEEIFKIFPNKNNILCVGCIKDLKFFSTTDIERIKTFYVSPGNYKFIITTYHSCHLLVNASFRFDFKIGDEAHHLVGTKKDTDKNFLKFHEISSKKTLFMTATEKVVETKLEKVKISMDDDVNFGKTIDVKSIYWAIENKKITDYNILLLKNTQKEVEDIIAHFDIRIEDHELFISAYMCLKSIEKYKGKITHTLLYTNKIEQAKLANYYIEQILDIGICSIDKKDIYTNALHSENSPNLKKEVDKFKNSKYGIISCVHIFGEGFDLPKLNSICIAKNMQSQIRIVQYILRANRLDSSNPTKMSYVIIPYIEMDEYNKETNSYENIRHIIHKMRNFDEKIEEKIKVLTIHNKRRSKYIEQGTIIYNFVFEDNPEELKLLILRLIRSKTLTSNFTEKENVYNYFKQQNKILQIDSKQRYIELQKKNKKLIPDAEEYFRGIWKGWYDFLGVDISIYFKTKEELIKFCKEKNITSNNYLKFCKIEKKLPKNPGELYPTFANIVRELDTYKRKR